MATVLPSIMASTTPPPSSGYKSGCICCVRRQPSLNFESPLFGPAPVPTLGATRRISRCQPVKGEYYLSCMFLRPGRVRVVQACHRSPIRTDRL